jgi:hypothetical protein
MNRRADSFSEVTPLVKLAAREVKMEIVHAEKREKKKMKNLNRETRNTRKTGKTKKFHAETRRRGEGAVPIVVREQKR